MQRNMVHRRDLCERAPTTPCAFLGDRPRQITRRYENADNYGFAFRKN